MTFRVYTFISNNYRDTYHRSRKWDIFAINEPREASYLKNEKQTGKDKGRFFQL